MTNIRTPMDMIAHAHEARITRPDGSELAPLARIAAAVYIEADYQQAIIEDPVLGPREGFGEHEARAMHARGMMLLAMLGSGSV